MRCSRSSSVKRQCGHSAAWPLHLLAALVAVWVAADEHTLSVRVPRHLLDDGGALRVAAHVVLGGVERDTWAADLVLP